MLFQLHFSSRFNLVSSNTSFPSHVSVSLSSPFLRHEFYRFISIIYIKSLILRTKNSLIPNISELEVFCYSRYKFFPRRKFFALTHIPRSTVPTSRFSCWHRSSGHSRRARCAGSPADRGTMIILKVNFSYPVKTADPARSGERDTVTKFSPKPKSSRKPQKFGTF